MKKKEIKIPPWVAARMYLLKKAKDVKTKEEFDFILEAIKKLLK